MSFFDQLVKIFPNLKNVFSTIKILSDNKSSKTIIYNGLVLQINTDTITDPDQKKALQDFVRKSLQPDSPLIIENESDNLLEEFKARDLQHKSLLEYFRNKIPVSDYHILRASLFLKSQLDDGKPTERLKEDIVLKYGDRGRNIANLCSSGYFESFIKPLSEKIIHDFGENSLTQFSEIYEVIVTQSPVAIFVNRWMSEEELKAKILKQIAINRHYGINYLNIHGISRENVRKISKIINEAEISNELLALPEIIQGPEFVHIRIIFKCPPLPEIEQPLDLLIE